MIYDLGPIGNKSCPIMSYEMAHDPSPNIQPTSFRTFEIYCFEPKIRSFDDEKITALSWSSDGRYPIFSQNVVLLPRLVMQLLHIFISQFNPGMWSMIYAASRSHRVIKDTWNDFLTDLKISVPPYEKNAIKDVNMKIK